MRNEDHTYALVVCRGKSTQHAVINPTIHEKATALFVSNKWKYGAPNFILEKNDAPSEHHQYSDYFANLVKDPNCLVKAPGFQSKLTLLECSPSFYKKRYGRKKLHKNQLRSPPLVNWVHAAADSWKMSDKGLRCILLASMNYDKIVVVGFDLWEADYWTDGKFTQSGEYSPPNQMTSNDYSEKPNTPNHKERIARGTRIKDRVLDLLFNFMNIKEDSKFEFYTLSKTLYERQKEEKLPNVTVELIEKVNEKIKI